MLSTREIVAAATLAAFSACLIAFSAEPLWEPRAVSSRSLPAAPPRGQAQVFGRVERGGWTDLFAGPDEAGERLAQLLMGERVRIVGNDGIWSQILLEEEASVAGWVKTSDLRPGTIKPQARQVREYRFVVVAIPGFRSPDAPLIPFGAVLPMADAACPGAVCLSLPDGSVVRLPTQQVSLMGTVSLDRALTLAAGLRHVRYQRGGNTVEAMDGPGLVQLVYRLVGLRLPRSLSEILNIGDDARGQTPQAGDVVFFRTFDPDRPQPVLLLGGAKTFLEAGPGVGVEIGFPEMRNRDVVAVRRFRTLPALE